jgi:hypothetical protein
VEKDNQVAGSLIEQPVASSRETNSQLAKPSVDLRGDRKLGRRRVWLPPVQALLDRIVDLRRRKRLGLQQLLQEDVNRLATAGVSIEDRLCPPA